METPPSDRLPARGIGLAVSAYLVWGLTPLYWKAIAEFPATEVLIPRILWSVVLLWVIAQATGRMSEIGADGGKAWLWTATAALLLAGNWGVFIYAIQIDQVIATSLGYYINPLMSILLGMLILGERLNPLQALAVAVAAVGVTTLTLMAGELPWISLVLALSFALYGLIHKLRPQPPLGGLLREMLVLSPIALLALAGFASGAVSEAPSTLTQASLGQHAVLSLTGLVTIVPLLLFHAATKQLPLVAVGMFQYIAPTITLGLATFVYGEPFTRSHAIGFGLVWMGLILFSYDSIRRSRAQRANQAALRT
ncbi:MAG: EamA family transporter RarD [Myxococcota bacterium]